MSDDELVPLADQLAQMEMDFVEFNSLTPELKQAALEYARGLQHTGTVAPEEKLDGEPQFIIVGVVQDGRHVIFASSKVTATRFARKMAGFDKVEVSPGRVARIPRIVAVVGAEMSEFEQYLAEDYHSGLQSLLVEWNRKAMMRQRGQLPR